MLKYGANFLPFQLNGQLNESSKEQHFHLPENNQTNPETSFNSHTYSLYSLTSKLQRFTFLHRRNSKKNLSDPSYSISIIV